MSDGDQKTACRTPAEGRDGITQIPSWKFDAVRRAILGATKDAGPEGLAFKDLTEQVAHRLDPETKDRLGSLGWHTTTVKLELEVRGELIRLPGRGPQRMALPSDP